MIGWVIGGLVAAGVGLAMSRSLAKGGGVTSNPANPNATTPGYESGGGSLDGALDVDAVLAVSPAATGRPVNGQIVQLNAVAFPGGGMLPLQVVAVATTVRPDGSARVAAKMTSATIKAMIAQSVPGFSTIPLPLQRDGVFVQFDSSRVWGLGGMVPT